MKKRLFSLILAFALLLSAVPTVFAATHHEVVIDGVVYWVYPEEGYAEIHSTVRGSLPQVLEIPQYVNGYPVTRLDTFGLTDLEGVVGVILPDTMTFIDDISIAGFDLVFVSLPNNEVNIEKNFVGAHALDYYYLPQNFSLSPECSAYGSKLFASHTCVGYEKHRAFARDLIPMDAHPDSQYVPANSGVFRVDGNELTAIPCQPARSVLQWQSFRDGLCGQRNADHQGGRHLQKLQHLTRSRRLCPRGGGWRVHRGVGPNHQRPLHARMP